ncbi:ataxin-2 like protein, putative [Plasmodium malariae]|uniref:Ataxin-2 like protein, putative n=1 Tax=Plasmodium malariae TaxID=5858 RepID=A0A1C3KES8_PLAMA|nr:ataxin-2 like protein, putative [Plasmodium malariae]
MKKSESGNSQDMHLKNVNQERLAHVMACLIGNEVNVHMKDGNEIRGLFHAYNSTIKEDKKQVDISLNFARVLPKDEKVSGPINKAMIIPENLYTIIVGKNIKLDLKDPDEVKNLNEKFKLDGDISEKKKKFNSSIVNRELKRWVCDSNDFDDSKLKLDEENINEPWDQFEHNRKLYGVTTTYKEEIYTTNLDINKIPQYVKVHADKIAKELEYRGIHLDPEDAERDNKDLDEEDLFGAVRQNKEKFTKNQKFKKEENKYKQNQAKSNQFIIKDLKEKIQLVKKENEKKYPSKKGINALNLEPALPKLDDKTRIEWIMFKNKTKNKSSNKKDKSTEKQEFITASREFNEKLTNKMNLNAKMSNTKLNKGYAVLNQFYIDNQKNECSITDYYQNVTQLPDAQNQKYPYAHPNFYKNGGVRPPYQNMNLDMMLNKFHNSMNNIPSKGHAHQKSNSELCPFPVKAAASKHLFDKLISNALKLSEEEDYVNSPLEFNSTQKLSYRNILGEIASLDSINSCQEANNFSNNIPMQQNISNVLVNFPFIPIMNPAVNNRFLENPHYLSPYFRNYYPNNSTPVNTNNAYFFNMPLTNVDVNYSSNKNMNLYPPRSLHAQNSHINFPVPSHISSNINYAVNNNNSLNIISNSNAPNPNLNIPPYVPEFVHMNMQKYPNHQSVPVPFFPQYQYQNYYTSPTHGMNNA